MQHYSLDIKETMVSKLCSPGGPSALRLAKETGISQTSLCKWKRELGGEQLSRNKRSQDWTIEDKIKILFETQSLSEKELGVYLREKGLHSHDLQEWKESLGGTKRGRPKLDSELVSLRKEKKELERELRRKDKALAEASAILILKKKAAAIWGTGEDDE